MRLNKAAASRAKELISRAELGDSRRTERAVAMVGRLSEGPSRPLPEIFATEAELEAAYRFLRSEDASAMALLDGIGEGTAERARRATGKLLVVHDTTSISCPAADGDEVGWLDEKTAGFFFHHTLVLECNGEHAIPLGTLWGTAWGRPRPPKRPRNGKRVKRSGAELARKDSRESDRWLQGVRAGRARLGDRECIHVMDREGDSFRLLHGMVTQSERFVVRGYHDRRLHGHPDAKQTLQDVLQCGEVVLNREVRLSRRIAKSKGRSNGAQPAREKRTAELVATACTVTLAPPRYERDLNPITVNVVYVYEPRPPAGEEPIAWILLTSETADTSEHVAEVIDTYRARWTIEEFHKVLKTGCWANKRNLESFESLLTNLVLCLSIAVELLHMRTLARISDKLPATAALSSVQLAALRAHPDVKLPADPTLQEALLAFARLGGHIRSNGPPGWRVLARGYETFRSFAAGFEAATRQQKL